MAPYFGCDATRPLRREEASVDLQVAAQRVQQLGEAEGEAFCRGLLPDPERCFPRAEAPEEHHVRCVGCPREWQSEGDVFVDGSASSPTLPCVRRAGWSIVQIDDRGRFVCAMYGVVPLKWGPSRKRVTARILPFTSWHTKQQPSRAAPHPEGAQRLLRLGQVRN